MLDRPMNEPFDRDFNDAITAITRKLVGTFTISATDAPNTYKALKAHLDAGKRMVVASEGSENTIFGNPLVNFSFRAWHDWSHWKGGHDFSLAGEMYTCNLQIEHLIAFYGVNELTKLWSRYLSAEVVGQRVYYKRYGEYIHDQRAFVAAYLDDPAMALNSKW